MVESTKFYDSAGNAPVLAEFPSYAKKVLDLGCGAGNVGKNADNKNILWDGITIDNDEAHIARNYYRNVVVYNLENGLPLDQLDRDYDVCVCSHVLEHIISPGKLMEDLKTVLAKNRGILIIAIPNILNHEIRMKLLRGKFEYRESGIMDLNHVRWYTFKTGAELLRTHGFSIEKAWAEGLFPMGRFLRNNLPLSLKHKIDRFFCKRYPGLFGYQLLYTAKFNG